MKKLLGITGLFILFMALMSSNGKVFAREGAPQPTITPRPGVEKSLDYIFDKENIIESGDYSYTVISESEKIITIRIIRNFGEVLKIPEKIDGYNVVGLSHTWYLKEGVYRCPGYNEVSYMPSLFEGDISIIKEVQLPNGLLFIGDYAFQNCVNIRRINIPKTLNVIGKNAFSKCGFLRNWNIPSNVILDEVAFSDIGEIDKIVINSGKRIYDDFDVSIFGGTHVKKLILANGDKHVYWINNIDEIVVEPTIKTLCLPYYEEDGTDNKHYVKKLYVKGKNTKIVKYHSSDKKDELTHIDAIYTVKDAKIISAAKKSKIKYLYKTSKPVKVKNNKWKKVKTTTVTNKYNTSKKKWQVTKKNSTSIYKVYAKNKKSGKYKLVETTKKNHTKKKYKYVKVKVDLGWE